MKKKGNLIIISLIIILIITIILLFIRLNTNGSSTLTCVKDIPNNHETLTFRYDVDGNMYSYNKELKLYNMDANTLNEQYEIYNNEYTRVKDLLNDNFKYEIIKNDNNMNINVNILVSIYSNYFNQYTKDDNIKSYSKLEDVKNYLLENEYKCTIRK
ncbi:MAG: hypothetical protein IKP76_01745 [Bacilli bacterium]|nr:hypothetical protein [Bacilli bacterium]